MMNFTKYFELFLEMNNVGEFMLNPEHSSKSFDQLVDLLRQSGGKQEGMGCYGSVFSHPSWNYVLKTFKMDDCYVNFIRFAAKQNSTAFPKMYGTPKRIVPQYTRKYPEKKIYILRLEKLVQISAHAYADIISHIDAIWQIGYDGRYSPVSEEYLNEHLETYKDSLTPNIIDFLRGFNKLVHHLSSHPNASNYDCRMDIHSGNIMQRPNGDIVITDPFAEGSDGLGNHKRHNYRKDLRLKRNEDIVGGKTKPVKKPSLKPSPKPTPSPTAPPPSPFKQSW